MTEYEPLITYHAIAGPIDLCGCHYCHYHWSEVMDELDPDGWLTRLYKGEFILCKTCGNKRCPQASYHGHKCTGSNESGQGGSVYGDFDAYGFCDND